MKVLVIDDHALFRVGLEGLLERRGIRVIAAVGEPQRACALVTEHQPDVVLLDMRMPEMSGLQVLKELLQNFSELPVVMLTTSTDQNDLSESLRNGARGYLLKDMEPDALVSALHELQMGKTIVAPELTGALANLVKNGNTPERRKSMAPFSELTPREMEILCHLSEGQSNKVIARHLNISDGTVKLHVKAILRKLSVHSRVEAAVMAVEKGLCNKQINVD
ncbi:MAG: two-component system nitrate/nitrite response regulator NarL [Parasphingorhabdus sp.]|jgi:two-component system nitrate/nitrite response regulator NarL